MSNKNIKLIIGIGNPGNEYGKTYHSVGLLFADYLKNNASADFSAIKIIKSDVFMNKSGAFVKKAIKQSGLRPENVLVAQDDSDIEIGKFKLNFGRSAGGHKGIQSIIEALGAKTFWRLRIGIRRSPTGMPAAARRAKAGEFVLKKISAADKKTLERVFAEILTVISRTAS